MTFSEKLNYLMDVMNTKGYELSKATGMSTSSISQLKNGLRKKPQKAIKYKEIAKYFAEHCTAEYQRTALAQATGNPIVKTTQSNGELTDIILSWLVNESDSITEFISNVTSYSKPEIPKLVLPDTTDSSTFASPEKPLFYKGLNGKREAFKIALNHLISLDQCSGNIKITIEDNSYWLYEEPEFSSFLKSSLLTLINKGFSITYIINSTDKTGNAFSECTFWLPILITGKASIYYYPRIRDGLFRHAIICLENQFALQCSIIHGNEEQDIAYVSTEPDFVNSVNAIFDSVLSKCLPAMKLFESPQEVFGILTRFNNTDGREIRKQLSLSMRTMPVDAICSYIRTKYNPAESETIVNFFKLIPSITGEFNPAQQTVEISTLATVQQIKKGRVPIIYPGMALGKPLYYTPYTYALHLKEIVRLLETCPMYYFIPTPYISTDNMILFLKEGYPAIFHILNGEESIVAEIQNPDIIMIFWEYLNNSALKTGYDDLSKKEIISQLKHLINELS